MAGTASGEFVPPQLIYSGLTSKSLPKNVKFPSDWHLTTTSTYWSNEETMKHYIDKVIVPFIDTKRKKMEYSPVYISGRSPILSFQWTDNFDLLEKHHIFYVQDMHR